MAEPNIAVADEWFEFECPTEGQDFEIRPMPFPGDSFACPQCGKTHIITVSAGEAWRRRANGGGIEYIHNEWKKRRRPPEQMTIDTLRTRVGCLRTDAPSLQSSGNCHMEEDRIREDVLRAIARGAANPQELAALALTTEEIEFPRWYE